MEGHQSNPTLKTSPWRWETNPCFKNFQLTLIGFPLRRSHW